MTTPNAIVASCDLTNGERFTVLRAKRLRMGGPKVCAKHGQLADDAYVISTTDTSAAARRAISPYTVTTERVVMTDQGPEVFETTLTVHP